VAAEKAVGDYMMTCPNLAFAGYRSEHFAANRRAGATSSNGSAFVFMFDELPGTLYGARFF
jgi:hypothetical protein